MMGINKFIQAIAVLMGTIIGVGLFSLPYITAKVGIWTMLFYFAILGTVVILIGLIYGEITLRTKGLHRLPGYTKKYLGQGVQKLAFVSNGLGLAGASLAYLIVGGGFLTSFLAPFFGGNNFIYTLIFFFIGALLVFFGIKSIAKTEVLLLILFFAILGFISYRGFSLINIGNLFVFDARHLFLPYGAILFSLSGAALIPETKEMLADNPKFLKKVIFWAILVSALTYLFFIFIILGITGQDTSKEAISGLREFLGDGIVGLALIFGILTTFTSFLAIGLTLKKILWYDLKLKKNLAWFIACFIPLFLFLIGLNNFIAVISLTGGIMLAIDSIIIIFIYFRAKAKGDLKPAYSLNVPRLLAYSLVLFFILGIIYEIIYFIG